LAGRAALRATSGLIHQPAALVELLLARREHKVTSAVTAGKGLVLEQRCALLVRFDCLRLVCTRSAASNSTSARGRDRSIDGSYYSKLDTLRNRVMRVNPRASRLSARACGSARTSSSPCSGCTHARRGRRPSSTRARPPP